MSAATFVGGCSDEETTTTGTPPGTGGSAIGGAGGSGGLGVGGATGGSGGEVSTGGGGSGGEAVTGGAGGATGGAGGATGGAGTGGATGGAGTGGATGGAGTGGATGGAGTGGATGGAGTGGIGGATGGSGGSGGNCAVWYADTDADGYGDPNDSVQECTQPTGYVANDDDCDDTDDTVYPTAPELCDGLDNDCVDGVPTDEVDVDLDGYRICAGDCDDANDTVYPTAPELCDGLDNDCDQPEEIDEGVAVTFDGANYDTIQAGLDAASAAGGGGTVYVCPGTYQEILTVESDVTLLAIAGPLVTFVEPPAGQEANRLVTIDDTLTVTVEGLTLRGASPNADGGALWASTDGVTSVVNCIVSDNSATNGGGIYLLDGQLSVLDSVLELDSATGDGGAIYAAAGTVLVDAPTTSSTIRDNDAANGGGIYLLDGQLSVTDSTLELNTATGDGGAIYVAGGTVFIDAINATTTISENGATRGGGLAVIRSTTATVADLSLQSAVVTANTASVTGGGIYLEGTDAAGGAATLTATFEDTVIGGASVPEGNSANDGAGIAAVTSAELTFDGLSAVDYNQATSSGGGVWLNGAISVNGALNQVPSISHNHAGNSAGGIYVYGDCTLTYLNVASNTATTRGGGLDVSLEQSSVTVDLYDLVVQDNQAGNESSGEGGAISLSTGRLVLADCQILDNRAATGAGLVLQADTNVTMTGGAMLRNGWDLAVDVGNGAWVKSGSALLTVVTSNWGTGADDNIPFDVWVVAGGVHGYTGFGANATFTCTNVACG